MSERSRKVAPLAKAVEEALALLSDYSGTEEQALHGIEPLPSLLEQCERLCVAAQSKQPEPVRSLHHFACTGGTLISKCIGAMPNTIVLSEVDPLSPLAHPSRFMPADLVGLTKFSSRPSDTRLQARIFLAGLGVLYDESRRTGRRLVIRDHAHSHFAHGPCLASRPSLGELLSETHRLRSLVTVRHPLDSYVALHKKGWIHFSPKTLEEYACRYNAFLDHYRGVKIIRYEDFVKEPEQQMRRICEILELRYDSGFRDVFSAVQLSGDSGRSGTFIAPRPRRHIPESIGEELVRSPTYVKLCEKLAYDLTCPVSSDHA